MSALPRPALPPGPHRDLVTALHELHHRDGWRSLRALARETGVSHTTVSKAFSSSTLPSWGVLELLVEAMGGDPGPFHARWLAASAPATDAGAPTTAIAGRRGELDVVRHHLEAGRGLLLVTGEAGMGKTTVIEAACADRRGDVLAAPGRCLPLSSEVPLLPMAEALRHVGRVADGAVMAAALQDCPAYVREAMSTLLPEWSTGDSSFESDDRWLRQRLFAGVAELCRALSAAQAFAVVLEDLHWADDPTRDLVEHLVRHGDVRIVGSWRTDDPDVPERHQEWFARVRRDAAVLPLRPLTPDETLDQVRLLRPGTTPADAARIYARSLGQPLFTEQLAHADAGEPTYLGDLLDDRVSRLAGAGWTVASVLGVADRTLTADEVERATHLEDEQLSEALRELRSQRILDVDEAGVRLRHPLLAEAVRRRLLPGEAAAAHRAVAGALVAHGDAEPAEVARHWQGAGDAEQELAWQVRAARAAAERYAGQQSAAHWRRALELWPKDASEALAPPVRRHEVVAGIANQLDLAGLPREAVPVLEAELARSDPPHLYDVAERADLLRHLARFNSSQFVTGTRGLELVEQAIELLRSLPPTSELAAALTWQGTELEWHGRREEATAVLARAAEIAAEAGDRTIERSARAQWAWQLAASGDAGSVDHIERILQEFGQTDSLLRNLAVAVRHTDILLMACRPAEDVVRAAAYALDQAARWQITTNHAVVLSTNVAQAWRRAGMVDRAMAVVAPATDDEKPTGLPLLHVERAILEVLLGHLDVAGRRVGCLDLGVHEVMDSSILEAQLHLTTWTGRPADGFALAQKVLSSRHDEVSPGTVGDLLVLIAAAAADARVGDGRSARLAARRTLDAIRGAMHHDPFAPGAVLADRAALPQWEAESRRLLGQDSVEAWTNAATTWHDLDRPHDEAYCRWRAAQVALRDGHGTVAARLLRSAAARARGHVPLSRAVAATAAGAT